MKLHRFKRLLSLLLVAALLVGFYVPSAQAASTGLSWKETDHPIRYNPTHREVEKDNAPIYQPGDVVRVSIVLEDKPTIQAGFGTRNIAGNAEALAYGSRLKAKQDALAAAISSQVLGGKKLDVVWNLTLAANLISARIPYGHIEAVSQMDGVKTVILENRYEPCVVEREDVAQPQMYASLGMTGSSLTWGAGYTGAGSRVAVVDTGTDINHQSLDSGAYLYALEQNAAAAGLSYAEYVAKLDLLDAQEIASVLSLLKISQLIPGVTANQLYLSEKLPFAANYVDGNLTVDHMHDNQGEHGSHVAGIAAANRYIPSGSGYADALDTVFMAGVAPDAQLLTMKVFGGSSPYDSDYMAAVEDAIYLNCDSVNLSLGSSIAGMTANPYFESLLNYMTQTDTVVVASAGNSSNWGAATTFSYLYSEDVSFDTVGAPGSHSNFFTVASVENDGGVGTAFRAAGKTVLYGDVTGYGNTALATLDTSGSGTDYDYIFVDGLGYAEDYAGMDLNGKVVFCSRGTLNFADKANNAMALGAAAVIVYNNAPDGVFGMNLTGLSYARPCVSISQQDADTIRAASAQQTSSAGLTYYTGKMTILGKPIGFQGNSAYYTMSDFSSWGIPGSLELKPEITAPGGNICSLWGTNNLTGGGTDQYEVMSGTSMAAPAITGMAALVAQYLRETGLAEQEGMRVRHLAQSLLMSTAEPLYEAASGGEYYSLMNQGAGMARVDLATTAHSYILVEGQADGKVKAQLGDDPDRTGVYSFTFTINNLTDKAQDYLLSADVFRQDVFEYMPDSDVFLLNTWTAPLPAAAQFSVNGVPVGQDNSLNQYDLNGDGATNALDADYLLEYLLGNKSQLHGEGDVNSDGTTNTYDAHVLLALLNSTSDGTVNLPAGGSVTVDVKLTLTAEGRQLLESNYPNGTYVEAFVYAEEVSNEEGIAGTVHSIPVLAFYGNWSDPSMFDHGTLLDLVYMTTNTAPYLYQVVGPYGNALSIDYGDGTEYYFGGNPFVDDETYLPERNAFNSEDASTLAEQSFTLIRNATAANILISNAETGEEYLFRDLGELYSAIYSPNHGDWLDPIQYASVNWTGLDASGKPVPEGTLVEVTMTAAPEYYRKADGSINWDDLGEGTQLTTSFYIDNTAPEVSGMDQVDTILTVEGLDNRHVAAVVLMNANGTKLIAAETPNQTEPNVPISVDLDLSNVMGESFLLAIYDYASNVSIYEITLELPEIERPYLTVVDSQTNTYYGIDLSGNALELAVSDRGNIHAAEFVDGYVFEVVNGNQLYVASNDDLYNFRFLRNLDPNKTYGITTFLDLAYNYANETLYGLFYCEANGEATSVLCTIDMYSGEMTVLGEMPVDVNNLAIDGEGNFYSVSYGSPSLYTYTLADLARGTMNYVDEVGYYGTDYPNSLAWDHNTDTLYWAFPNTLLKVHPETAEPTLLGYNNYIMVGLFITPETYGDRFAPTDNVVGVTLDHTENRTLVDNTITLTAQVWPWNVSDDSVAWSSSNTSVATVNENGTVTGVAPGTATITAASKLDPSKKASCVITIEKLDKTLNSIVWDEMGDVWWAEFNTADLPSYTKLSSTSAEDYITSTALMPDGKLYASTIDVSTGYVESLVYTVDPDTFEMTYVGQSSAGYTDIAPAPHIHGGALAAVYFNYVLFVDTDTGDFYTGQNDIYEMFYNNLVGIAYAGSTEYQNEMIDASGTLVTFDNYIDWYFIIDVEGFVYCLGWIEAENGKLYYLEHPDTTGGIYTVINAKSDTPYFSSLYFDGEFLYYSCYNSAKENNTLYAIDTMGNHKAYTLGNFGAGIWPVSGLMELDVLPSADLLNVNVTAEPKATEHTELSKLAATVSKKSLENVSNGGLNSIAPASYGEYHEQPDLIVVQVTGEEAAPNGLMTVTYDPSALQLTGIANYTDAFAYKTENGKITLAFANAAALPGEANVATLSFKPLKAGEHTVTISHKEAGNAASHKEERITVEVPGEEEAYTMNWASVSTTLGGNIGLNFYAEMSANLVNNPDTFVRFTFAGRTVDVPMADATVSVNNGTNLYRFTCPITSKNMTDVVSAQVMVGDEPVGKVKTMDVATYCNWVIENFAGDAKTVNLMKAMLNYGASAQMLFNYRTDDLANAALSDADKVLGKVDASAYAHNRTGEEEGIVPVSYTLLLDSETTVRCYFQLTGSKSIDEYTFTVDGVEVEPTYKDGYYYIEKTNIAAHRLDDMHVFTCGGITITYGGLSYVNQVMNFYTEGTTFDMASALFAYSKAAEAYIG